MIDRDRDDIYYGSAAGERTRRQKRLPKPLVRLLFILAAIVILVVVIVVVARSAIHSGEAADYQRYMTAVADILKKSDTVGADLTKLLTEPRDTNRTQVQAQFDDFIATSEQLDLDAKALDAPKDLVQQSIHQMFLLVMSFRQIGVSDLKPALMNALEVQDTEVSAEQISHALCYLTNSDFLYDEVFMARATDVLQRKNLEGVTVPSSTFMADPDMASNRSVLNILTGLRSVGSLQAIHGVAVDKVVAKPEEKEIKADGTYNLTSSQHLVFEVTVENQGNMEEKNVKVVVTLESPGAEQQKVTKEIPVLKAKTSIKVPVDGLNPTPYGEVALLTVKAGPVPNEKSSANNSIEAHVIFKL